MNTKKKIEIEWNAKGNPYPCSKCRQGEWIETSIPCVGFHNDKKCICDCHTSHPTPEPSAWERGLENLLTKMSEHYLIDDEFESELKWFISTLLTQQREELIEKIEKMKQQDMFSSRNSSYPIAIPNSETTKAYNEALDDILNSLKGEGKGGEKGESNTTR